MPTMLRVCIEPGCHQRQAGRRCAVHERTSSRNHRGVSRQERGYDAGYERDRALLIGQPCAMRLPGCTGIGTTPQHTDDGRLIPACAHCNYADGARRARLTTGYGGQIPRKSAAAKDRLTAPKTPGQVKTASGWAV